MQIEEPNDPNIHIETNEIAIGIDLGTTNSLSAISDCGAYQVLADIEKSAVLINKNGTILSGNEAMERLKNHPLILQKFERTHRCEITKCYKNKSDLEPDFCVIKSVKSLIGRGDEDIEIFGTKFSATQISGEILKVLRKKSAQILNVDLEKVKKAVITVPAYFDDAQRAKTKQAAELAGLEVLRLINEPTAAALAYGIDHHSEGLYAIFDLGGGTFDVSVLQMQMGVFKVIATGGDTTIGGDDFDNLLANKFNISKADACYIKEHLSSSDVINRPFLNLQTQKPTSIHLKIHDFDELILPLVHKIVDIFRGVIKDAKIENHQINGVVFVGGGTRMKIIKEAIAHEFTDKIFQDLDPDRVVAFGASIQAENLTRRNINTLLLDVTPLSLGIELMGGSVQKIIYRNTQIPFLAYQSFTTYEDNQNAIEISIVQGERDMARDCRVLGKFALSGIPPMPAGVPDVKISFFIDADGILTVSAREEFTGIEQKLEIRPTYGIDTNDVIQMIEDSMKNAKIDIKTKLDSDQKTEALGVVKNIESKMQTYSHLLNEADKTNIMQIIANLKALINAEVFDRKTAHNLVYTLNDLASPFVKTILEEEIRNIKV